MYERKLSNWQPWNARRSLANLDYPGIYCLAISESRLTGRRFSWRAGIVYVGMTNSKAGLAGRLHQFNSTISGRHVLHGGADRFRYKHLQYSNLCAHLYVAVAPFPCDVARLTPKDLEIMGQVARFEYQCLAQYARRFGRLPEFNDKQLSPKFSQSSP